MKYGISSLILARTKLQPTLRKIADAGIAEVEILAEPPHFWPPDHDPQQVKGWLNKLRLRVRVGHGIYSQGDVNCGATDETQRQESVALIATCFEPLVTIGAEFVVLHPTGYSNDYNDQNRQRVLEQARQSIRQLATIGKETGIKLAWENLPHHNSARPLHDMAELRELIDDMPEHVGLCLDTTHALISGHDPLDQLNIAADRLFCLHLHDSDGKGDRHWVPGRGIIEWEPFIRRLDELAFTGTRTIEVASTHETEVQVLAEAATVARQWERQ